MSYGLWLSAAGMQTNKYRMNVMSNNMANMNTVGFKRDVPVFHERLVESQTKNGGSRHSNAMLDSLSY